MAVSYFPLALWKKKKKRKKKREKKKERAHGRSLQGLRAEGAHVRSARREMQILPRAQQQRQPWGRRLMAQTGRPPLPTLMPAKPTASRDLPKTGKSEHCPRRAAKAQASELTTHRTPLPGILKLAVCPLVGLQTQLPERWTNPRFNVSARPRRLIRLTSEKVALKGTRSFCSETPSSNACIYLLRANFLDGWVGFLTQTIISRV